MRLNILTFRRWLYRKNWKKNGASFTGDLGICMWHTEIMPYSNVDEVKNIWCFFNKKYFCSRVQQEQNCIIYGRDKVSLFQQMKNFNVYLGSVIWTYRTSGQWIIRIANAGIERNIVKPTEKIFTAWALWISMKGKAFLHINNIYRAMIYLSVHLFIMLLHMHCI